MIPMPALLQLAGPTTEPGFGVMSNWMLFKASVWLAVKVSWLIKGVAPAFCPVIVIVVSSAWLAPANAVPRLRSVRASKEERDFIFSHLGERDAGSPRKNLTMPISRVGLAGPPAGGDGLGAAVQSELHPMAAPASCPAIWQGCSRRNQ